MNLEGVRINTDGTDSPGYAQTAHERIATALERVADALDRAHPIGPPIPSTFGSFGPAAALTTPRGAREDG